MVQINSLLVFGDYHISATKIMNGNVKFRNSSKVAGKQTIVNISVSES